MSKYSLQLTLDNGRVIDAGEIEVRDGVDGKDGADGKDGLTTSVNGVEQENGNIELKPDDIGACPENENLVECVDGALKTLAGTALGLAKIATGSYVGTGLYGENNPVELTFDFEPKMLVIIPANPNNRTYANYSVSLGQSSIPAFLMTKDMEYALTHYHGSFVNQQADTGAAGYQKLLLTWGKTVSFYSNNLWTDEEDGTQSAFTLCADTDHIIKAQFNVEGATYYYVAIG